MGRNSRPGAANSGPEPAQVLDTDGNGDAADLDLDTLPIVDEQLFLIRRAAAEIGRVFSADPGDSGFGKTLAIARRTLVGDHEYAAASNMLPEVVDVIDLTLQHIDALAEFLIDVDLLSKDFLRTEAHRQSQATVDGVIQGGQIGGGLALAGVEPITAMVVIGGQVVKKAVEESENQRASQAAQEASYQKRLRRYEDQSRRLEAKMTLAARGKSRLHSPEGGAKLRPWASWY